MATLIITTKTDSLFTLTVGVVSNDYPKEYVAKQATGDYIDIEAIKNDGGNLYDNIHYSEIEIDGVVGSTVYDSIDKINSITSFGSSGGGATGFSTEVKQDAILASIDSSKPKNDTTFDAWGRTKVIKDFSIFHGVFTFNIPVSLWKEEFNGIERDITNATSVNGALEILGGATLDDKTKLSTYRNPRYQPNRGHLYSNSIILPNKAGLGNRRFGLFTDENGTFFSLENGVLYGVVRTTKDAVTTEDKYVIDTTGIDLEKGNVFDIQFQWRGVGGYKFFINLTQVLHIDYLGTLSDLSMSNPALPAAYESENKGNDVKIISGCVDITSEGGTIEQGVYGSVNIENQSGQVNISGFNQPVIAIRSKDVVNGKINTRDTLALLASGYSDQRALLRVWVTRDNTAITENNQVWKDYGDGHLEYIVYDTPDVATPMTFDTTKAVTVFGSRVKIDETYATSALFEGRTNIYLTPGDIFIFTMHRETGGSCNVGVTFEFAEEI